MVRIASLLCVWVFGSLLLSAQSSLSYSYTAHPHNFSGLDSSLVIKDAYVSGETVWAITSNGVFHLDSAGAILPTSPARGFAGLLRSQGEIIGYETSDQGLKGVQLIGGEGRVKSSFLIPNQMSQGETVVLEDRVLYYAPKYWDGPFAGTLGEFQIYELNGSLKQQITLDHQLNAYRTSPEGYTAVAGQEAADCGALFVFDPDGNQILAQKTEWSLEWMDPYAKRLLMFETKGKTEGAMATFYLLDEVGRTVNNFEVTHWIKRIQGLGHQKYILFEGELTTRLLDWKTGEELWQMPDFDLWAVCLSWDQKTLFRFSATPESGAQGVVYTVTAHEVETGKELGSVDIFRDAAHFDEVQNRFAQTGEHTLELCDSKGCFLIEFLPN